MRVILQARFQVWAQDLNEWGGQSSPYQVASTATMSEALGILNGIASNIAYGWAHWEWNGQTMAIVRAGRVRMK